MINLKVKEEKILNLVNYFAFFRTLEICFKKFSLFEIFAISLVFVL